jgi:glycosyltransferase involved in cell wall biosynthesis
MVPPSDPSALAQALKRLLTEPAEAERMANAAREQALTAHGLPLMRERYEALFERVLRQPQPVSRP